MRKKYKVRFSDGLIKEIPSRIYKKYLRFLNGKVEQMINTWRLDFKNELTDHFKRKDFEFIKKT